MRILAYASLAAVLTIGSAAAQEPIVLKLTTGTNSASATYKELIGPWAEKVEADSEGTIKFEIYADGQLSKMGDTFTRVAAGVADVGWDLPGLYGAEFGSIGVTALPGLYTNPGLASPALHRGLEKGTISDEMDRYKIIFINASVQGTFYLKEPLKSNIDFEGRKIATSSKPRAELAALMNAVSTSISPPQQYAALQKGALDGCFSSSGAVNAWKLYELTHYYIVGPFGGGSSGMLMNKEVYEKLPPKAKKAIDMNSGPTESKKVGTWFYDFEESFMTKILQDPQNKRVSLTEEELKALQPHFDAVAESWAKSNPGGAETLKAFKDELAASTM